MVECKYRNPGVQWVWTAEAYGGPGELYQNSFLHPLDEFVSQKFPFKTEFPRQLGPCCSKGVELHPEGASESAIVQAASQVAHAFGTKIADAIERQVRHLCPGILVHYHVPVIVTTAPMFRLFEDASVANVSAAEQYMGEVLQPSETRCSLSTSSGVTDRGGGLRCLSGLRMNSLVVSET